MITTGRAYYSGLGFTHDAETPAELQFHLSEIVLNNKIRNDYLDVARFFHIYKRHVLLPRDNVAAIARKVVSVCVPHTNELPD